MSDKINDNDPLLEDEENEEAAIGAFHGLVNDLEST